MDRLGTRGRYVASIPRDDTQGRTRGFLGLCRKTSGNWNQKEVLKSKNSRKQAENSRKTDKNRSKRTPNARRQHKTSSPKSASQVSGNGDKQRYPKQPKQADKKFQKVKNLDKNRTKQRPANAEKCAKCCSRPLEMETQAAPHVGSSPEPPARAIGAFRKVPKRQVMKKVVENFSTRSAKTSDRETI